MVLVKFVQEQLDREWNIDTLITLAGSGNYLYNHVWLLFCTEEH